MSLGLGSMDDRKFDRYFVDQTLERFLERGYGRNGEGGLFTVDNGPRHAEHGNLVSDELLPARNHQGGRHLA